MALVEDRFAEENEDQVRFYLASMFENRRGYVSVAFGHNPKMSKPRFDKDDFVEAHYRWPDEAEELIGDVDSALNHPDTFHQNVEIFICPALRKKPSRKQGDNAPLFWVWADLDEKPSKEQLAKINKLGAMTILSGSEGHRHVYLPLQKPVSNVAHKALCLALKDVLGAKDSKIADNDLLRLPGTLNWKQLEPQRVMVKRRCAPPRRNTMDLVNELCALTGKPWASYKRHAEGLTPREMPDVRDVPKPKLKPASRKAYSYQPTEDGSRHDAIFKLVKTMQEDGYTRDQMHAVLYDYPPAVSKWGSDWRIANDVDRIWQKYSAEYSTPRKKSIDAAEDDGTEQPLLKFHDWATVVERVASAPPPQYLFQGVWVEGDYGVLSAPDKSGKSWAMADAAISCASQTPWMNKWECPNGGAVIICFGEGSERKQIRRAKAIARHKGIEGDEFSRLPIHPMFSVPQINDDDHLEELEAKIRQVKPALVIIDPFYLAAAGADSANLVQMGSMLNRIQLVCQRHNAALMLSHHWNKSTTASTDVHARSSGVGLTAWGRVLISVELMRSHTDPTTMRSSVSLAWHIKGDEIAEQRVDMVRDVWEDSPGDLGCDMNYQITLSTEEQTQQQKPIQNAPTMERVSQVLEDNHDGLGIRKILVELREQGKPVGPSTVKKCLDQLVLHGFVQEGRPHGQIKPFLLVKPFTRDLLDPNSRINGHPINGHSLTNGNGNGAVRPRELDFASISRHRK